MWSALLTKYQAEKNFFNKAVASGSGASNRKTWSYYRELQFIDHYNQHRNINSSIVMKKKLTAQNSQQNVDQVMPPEEEFCNKKRKVQNDFGEEIIQVSKLVRQELEKKNETSDKENILSKKFDNNYANALVQRLREVDLNSRYKFKCFSMVVQEIEKIEEEYFNNRNDNLKNANSDSEGDSQKEQSNSFLNI